jgi:hypothetical protein
MSENTPEQSGDRQDPAEPNQVDTEVPTEGQPAPSVQVSPAEPPAPNGDNNVAGTQDVRVQAGEAQPDEG